MSIRERFLSLSELKRERVEVPGLGSPVWVRQLTAGERDEFELSLAKAKGKDRQIVRARIVALVATDDDGARVFGEDDVAAISALPANVVEPIMEAHVRLNAMTKRDVDELAKNSEGGPDA